MHTIGAATLKGNPMARDSQAALVALNRFGFGARGGASGDFINAASDPRGFVKAELDRPNGALLEAPGLQPTPALAQEVFAYQLEQKQAREAAAAKSGAAPPPSEANPSPSAADGNVPRRNLSLDRMAMEMSPKAPDKEPVKDPAKASAENANAAMAPADAM